eukprot:TRINITY_DN1465_c0_g1_i3.p1 TRINITY_DN1465_c0_g1~~TRINITY_DN1465_c0_g1_i3.p1  ORF type:complete len:239 (-),score=59.32 TRINITY_DN1465_c0_g1_i3:191-907(-)
MRDWDAALAAKANITIPQLRGYEKIFKTLDPDDENEINVTKFVRGGLGRNTIKLQLTSRDLRRLFAALRQASTKVGDPAHISLPVNPNEFLMAMATPPMMRRDLSEEEQRFVHQFADAVRQAAGFPSEPRPEVESVSAGVSSQINAPAASVSSGGNTVSVSTTQSVAPRKVQRSRLVREDQDPEENKYHKTLLHQLFDSTLQDQLTGSGKQRADPKRIAALVVFILAICALFVVYGNA